MCNVAHACTQGRAVVVHVDCRAAWLRHDHAGVGSLSYVMQHHLFRQLSPVKAYLSSPSSCLVPASPSQGLLRVRLRHMSLVLLAALSQDPSLQAALYSSHPWEALAVHWRCYAAGRSSKEDGEEAGAADAADHTDDSGQEGELGDGKGGKKRGKKKGKDGLASMDALLKQLCGCGTGSMGSAGGRASAAGKVPAAAAVAAAAAAAQVFVGGLVLGERVHQLAERLACGGRAPSAKCSTRNVDPARKAATKQLLTSFLEAFPDLAAHRTGLVDQAMARNGWVG
ncbi:hypothetical protein DUNSADRAFT_5820 [Dunaliella salina]|uniref:Uncharacterized protein n=1 Tax=Dunaliella salina TaxID=3046 RepID=A0ABQ7GPK1_DUNSA|nr:hypothetical protein DUNSADRAFT_5820 [Dunaliella salina]|eukprot:KAF5836532.1 hypothetical protein DUNSADRAFT_5820 [Dunaliella salina]